MVRPHKLEQWFIWKHSSSPRIEFGFIVMNAFHCVTNYFLGFS